MCYIPSPISACLQVAFVSRQAATWDVHFTVYSDNNSFLAYSITCAVLSVWVPLLSRAKWPHSQCRHSHLHIHARFHRNPLRTVAWVMRTVAHFWDIACRGGLEGCFQTKRKGCLRHVLKRNGSSVIQKVNLHGRTRAHGCGHMPPTSTPSKG